jgi:hypothetical protein
MYDNRRIDASSARLHCAGAVYGPRAAGVAGAGRGTDTGGWVRSGAEQAWLQREERYAGLRDGAVLLTRMIDQMGGGAGSLPRGVFVNLDA